MILLIDNYDSFVFNLARYFRRLDQDVVVLRNDVLAPAEIRRLRPQAIVLSPGPCTPRDAGLALDVVRTLHREIPFLGVCLGHQVIAEALGGRVIRAPEPVHGRVSTIQHDHSELFAGIPDSFQVCRYHSLMIEPNSLPSQVRATARTSEGILMAIEHTAEPVFGVQFHPEATLTQFGYLLLKNFLQLAGLRVPADVAELTASEFRLPSSLVPVLPQRPVTF